MSNSQMSNPHKQAADLYRNSSHLGLNSRQVMTRLIGTIILNLEHAKNAHSQRQWETMTNYNVKTLKIIGCIRTALREDYIKTTEEHALVLAKHLRGLYQNVFIRLTNILMHKNPQSEFDSVIEILRIQYTAWEGNPQKTAQPAYEAPAANIPAQQHTMKQADSGGMQDSYA